LLLGEQRHNGCEQFALDSYPTASRLRFEPGPFALELIIRRDGVYKYVFITNLLLSLTARDFLKSRHLEKLQTRVYCLLFLTHSVGSYLGGGPGSLYSKTLISDTWSIYIG